MTKKRLLLIALAIAAVVALGLLGMRLLRGGDDAALKLYGNVDIRQVDLGFRVGGRIDSIAFEEGARVPAGATIATLDAQPLRDALTAAEARESVAAAELARTKAGSRPQEVAQAAARVAEAEAGLARAREDHQRRSGLVKTGAISRAVYDATVAQLRAAEAQVKAANEALSLAREGARVEDRQASAAQRQAAAADAARARTQVNDAVLTAPNAGTILTRAREPGAIVQPGETVVTLTIDRPLRVRAYVAEADLSRIRPGMAVEVSADGNPKIFHGIIAHISPTAEFTPKTVQTEDLRTDLVYRVRINVADPDDTLRQGQPVTVAIPGAPPRAKD